MGSLMSGWNSPRSGRIERKKSFTEEGIENFWKLKREVEEEHLKAVVETASTISEDDTTPISKIGGNGNQTFSGNRPARLEVSKSFSDRDSEDAQFVKDGEKLSNKKLVWWTRSNSAFLNEPPESEMEGPYKYTTQHHVATVGGQKQGLSIDVMETTS